MTTSLEQSQNERAVNKAPPPYVYTDLENLVQIDVVLSEVSTSLESQPLK